MKFGREVTPTVLPNSLHAISKLSVDEMNYIFDNLDITEINILWLVEACICL